MELEQADGVPLCNCRLSTETRERLRLSNTTTACKINDTTTACSCRPASICEKILNDEDEGQFADFFRGGTDSTGIYSYYLLVTAIPQQTTYGMVPYERQEKDSRIPIPNSIEANNIQYPPNSIPDTTATPRVRLDR
jgi:hypothetical protein